MTNRELPPIIPHADWGDPDCCGCMFPVQRGAVTDLICNECEAVIRTVGSAETTRTIAEMSLKNAFADTVCPHCGSVNLLGGFDKVLVYTCRSCGRAVSI